MLARMKVSRLHVEQHEVEHLLYL